MFVPVPVGPVHEEAVLDPVAVFSAACVSGEQRFRPGQVRDVPVGTLPQIARKALRWLEPERQVRKADALLSGHYYRVTWRAGAFFLLVETRRLEGEPERVTCAVVAPGVDLDEAVTRLSNGKPIAAQVPRRSGRVTGWTTSSTLGYQLRVSRMRDRWTLLSSTLEDRPQAREPTPAEADLQRSAALPLPR